MEEFNKYLYKAIDAYPYDLEQTIEALQYALSYDPKNVVALTLTGQVYAEQLNDYDTAISYFEEALGENIQYKDVYYRYFDALLLNESYLQAEKLINFAFRIKGIDKALILVKKAQLLERRKQYKLAIKHLKEAKKYSYNEGFISYISTEKSRIKKKINNK